MKTITEQRLADALRDIDSATRIDSDTVDIALSALSDIRSTVAEALAAYDAQQAQPVPAGAWVAEPITNVVSAPPLPRRAYREPVAACNSAEYAARIVACVNACAGMTTAEVLEFGAPGELGRCAQAWVAEDNDNA